LFRPILGLLLGSVGVVGIGCFDSQFSTINYLGVYQKSKRK